MKALPLALALLAAGAAAAQAPAEPTPERQRQLVHLVRQDCGSCHGMLLTGGLGPALTAERLGAWPLEVIEGIIKYGRPGTPMPGWAPIISAGEVSWIARQLQLGFPKEAGAR